ncbi:MAG: OPT/YSL family transporter [Gemmataceae bacterium]|nr:OPT/YSL family transporter [Gemmataceae bacterium]
MAIHELTDEQINTWTLEEKDTWWLKNVYREGMPQLTIRSAFTGMILGGLLSLTNLYVGAKTGWTLGVGITSVILAFAMFKVFSKLHIGQEFTVLENNAMQSIATAAGYMTSPMISSLAAYMAVTGHVIPLWQTMSWISVLAILGVLFAFPFKRRFINDEQQPFPEGRAAGIVMDSLHHGEAEAGLLKAKLLIIFGSLAAVVRLLQSEAIMGLIHLKSLTVPEFLDDWFYRLTGWEPSILGTPIKNLTLRPELDLPMVGAGGLMGMRTGASILLGALINYAILAPIMIERGDIVPKVTATTTSGWAVAGMDVPSVKVKVDMGFKQITFWSLWGGVAMMTMASLVTFFAKPQVLISAFSKLFTKRSEETTDVLGHIELPLKVSLIGVPILGAVVVWMAHSYFGVEPWLSVVALFLVFAFCLIAINSTGMTSITPIGAMGKLTQLTFGILAPKNIQANLMTAGITGEVASHSANLLQDIKPGYMLGAKPRQQAVGHVLGVLAGALLSVPVFYLVFLQIHPAEAFSPDLDAAYQLDPDKYPMPAATTWKAVADVLTDGIENIKVSAQWAALIGILLGLVLEVARIRSKNRFPLSPVGLGLGFIIPFHTCLSMFLGCFLFWLFEKRYPDKEEKMNQVVVQNQEPICAGLIAGGALMGIAVAVAELFVPGH